jgi:hypothetical protein
MSDDEPFLDSQTLSAQEFVARSILRRFPQSKLQLRESKADKIFEIYFDEKILLSLDRRGARYFFPSRRKRTVKWEKVTTFGLPRVIDYILRDLAEAKYEVWSTANKKVLKRPIHISRLMRCPECKGAGGVKLIALEETLAAENSEIYTTIASDADLIGAELKCTLCGWVGIREQLLRKMRKPRS